MTEFNRFIFKCNMGKWWTISEHNTLIQDCKVFIWAPQEVHSLYKYINKYRLWVLAETFHSVQNIVPAS